MVTKKVAVVGYPVKHSLSPKLHGYWIEKYNIDGEYGMLEVAPPDFEQVIINLEKNGYKGVNITVPYKEKAYQIIDEIGDLSITAKLTGAVNTICVQNGKLFGTNTDAYGFVENIKQNAKEFDFTAGKAVVLGAGGAARAVVAVIIPELVPEIVIVNRSPEKAEKIKHDLSHFVMDNIKYNPKITVGKWNDRNEILNRANLLVNSTVLGMIGQDELDINLNFLPQTALVTDIVYKPLETDLLKKARKKGNKVVDGLGMLLYQAQGGFELWFGMKPEVTGTLRNYILS
jgi:shikimate dehydrogenase